MSDQSIVSALSRILWCAGAGTDGRPGSTSPPHLSSSQGNFSDSPPTASLSRCPRRPLLRPPTATHKASGAAAVGTCCHITDMTLLPQSHQDRTAQRQSGTQTCPRYRGHPSHTAPHCLAPSGAFGSDSLESLPCPLVATPQATALLEGPKLSTPFRAFVAVQSLSCVRLSVTPWPAARQASLSITTSRACSLMSTESVIPSNHLFLCRPLLLLFKEASSLEQPLPSDLRHRHTRPPWIRWLIDRPFPPDQCCWPRPSQID